MGILGKDLTYFDYDFFKFTAWFSADNIEIEGNTYLHGEILTEFLNYDLSKSLFSIFSKREKSGIME